MATFTTTPLQAPVPKSPISIGGTNPSLSNTSNSNVTGSLSYGSGGIQLNTAPKPLGITTNPIPSVAPLKNVAPLPTSQVKTTSPSFSNSTLAQQKALNLKGAGLVEDGIMGPKTQAAITKYSAPTTPAPTQYAGGLQPNDPSNKYNTATGQLNTQYAGASNNQFMSDLNSYQPPVQTKSPETDISNQGLLQQLASFGVGKNENPQVTEARNELQALQNEYKQKGLNIENSAGFLTQATGLQGQLQNQYLTAKAAIEDKIQNALVSQSQQIGATQSAAGLTQPTTQFGMLTNPQSGQIVGGGGATASGVMQSSLQNAYNMYQQGASVQDIMATSGLDTFGVLGKNALINMINNGGQTSGGVGQATQGGSFNPTSYNTQVSSNQQNISNIQGQAQATETALKQIQAIKPLATNFLQRSGLNPYDASIYNGPVNKYLTSIGASALGPQWAAIMGDLQNYTTQLLASGYAGTPTGAESKTMSQDPSDLSYKDLQAYLQTLEDLGANRQYVLQQQLRNMGASGGYTGDQASLVNKTSVGTPGKTGFGTGITSPGAQFAAGGAIGILPGAAQAATQGGIFALGKKLLTAIGL